MQIMALGALTTAFRDERSQARPRKPHTPLLVQLGRAAAVVLPRWQTVRTITASVGGLGMVDAGLWQLPGVYGRVFGLVGIGAGLLVLEALSGGE